MSQIAFLKQSLQTRQSLSIFLIWLFHISAIVGISIGYEEWFMSKTPLNLTAVFLLLLWSFESKPLRFWLGLAFFFCGGMLLEWVGVHYGFLFGTYEYGSNLGPKLDGIPYLIGVNWAVLTLATGVMASAITNNFILRSLLGAGLMVFLDLLLEFAAPVFDFWTFTGGLAPFQNYVAWFGFSLLFHLVYQSLRLEGDTKFAFHLYAVHLVFFGYFYVWYY